MIRHLTSLAAGLAAATLLLPDGHAADTAASPATSARPPRIQASAFARRAEFTNLQISPNGTRVLATGSVDGVASVFIHDLGTGQTKKFLTPKKSELVWYRWAGDDRVLIDLAWSTELFGEEFYATRLYVLDVPTNQMKFIGIKKSGLSGGDVLYVDRSGAWILLALQKSILSPPTVFRADLSTGELEVVVKSQDHVWDWFADSAGVVRAGIGYLDRSWFMVYRRGAGEDFRKLGTARYDDDKATLDIIRMVRESDEGFVLSNEKTGRFALYRYNFATQALGDVVFESPTNDVDDFDLSDDGKSVLSVEYRDDADRIVWFDPTLKRHQQKIESVFPGKIVRMISGNSDRTRIVVWVGGAEDPGTYYVYLTDADQYQRIAQVNSAINPAQLSPARYTSYRARDGLDIPAYLTLPAGREPKGLPLIILPHGGPYGVRDVMEFNPEVQFLANRGYVVLQPNFRGSESYGKQFFEKGAGEWGRAMQDDLDDGMDWLVKDGIVDPKRVCIVGSSYGGYAALWGATRNPERYRCAASMAGITDVAKQLRYQVDLLSSRYSKVWQSRVKGTTDFDLDQISPLKQVERLRIPVLVAHGDDDTRVPYRQSSAYAAALAKAGKTHEFRTYAGEGHGFASSGNMEDWLTRLEAFLDKYNPQN